MLAGVLVSVLAAWLTGLSTQRAKLALTNVYTNILGSNPQRPEEKFRVVLCWLENDPKGINTGTTVEPAFRNVGGIELVRSARIVEASGAADDWRPAMRRGADMVLKNWDADLAIVGLVKEDKKSLSLWFVPHSGEDTLGEDNHLYKLENMTLGGDFHKELRARITAMALAAVAPLVDSEVRGKLLDEGLRNATKKLSTLLESSSSTIASQEHRAALHTAHGIALYAWGKHENSTERLEQAVAAYHAALEVYTRERAPDNWAATQNNLGIALRALGEHENGTERLEQAVEAYRAALEIRTHEHAPSDWAATQNNLGNALQTLGERESDTEERLKHLKQAVTACEGALEVWTREDAQFYWAIAQNNLGIALRALGKHENSTERLEQAVEAYHAALEVYTRERAPDNWAATQNNLGIAFSILGERENDTERLERAVEAYRAALEIRTREHASFDWAATQNNLGNTLRILGERENSTERLERAVEAYRAALEIRTRERAPSKWAATQNNLGIALQTLGEWEDSTEHSEQAVAAYEGALEVFTDKETPLYKNAKNGLDQVLQKLRKSNP